MFAKRVIATAAAALIMGSIGGAASAQSPEEMKIIALHQLCKQGDPRACIRFGMAIEHSRDRAQEWHRSHPEWFWYERGR